jgi:PAS domain S-box-containing protein
LHPPEWHDLIRTRIAIQKATNAPVPGIEEEIQRFDGRRVTVYVNALPIIDRGTFALLVVLHDLTEQKRLEQQLRYQEMMLREAAELAHVGGWGFDPVTGQGDWTPETARIHGLPSATVTTVTDGLGFYSGEDRVRIEAAVAEASTRGTPYDLELRLTAADGKQKWVRAICRPIIDNGKVVRVRGSFQDITDRKRAETEIRQLNTELERRVRDRTAELEVSNKELESFSYSVSHDLRAPIRHIAGFTRMVLDMCGPQLPAESRGHLEQVERAARRMGQLVDDLLAFSRLGRQPVRRQPVDARRLVEDCLNEVLHSVEGRQIETQVGDLPQCEADLGLLRQVWLNLLANAVKYSAKSDPAVIEIGATSTPEGIVYFVKDNGVGFDMRYVHKLFGVFQRLHRAEDFEGTGIGLALVQRIVHRHGGRVWAEAELNKGAKFSFTLGSSG